mgnify:CR=1 FL=1
MQRPAALPDTMHIIMSCVNSESELILRGLSVEAPALWCEPGLERARRLRLDGTRGALMEEIWAADRRTRDMLALPQVILERHAGRNRVAGAKDMAAVALSGLEATDCLTPDLFGGAEGQHVAAVQIAV